jgi:tetratricopeptide (TPR) repeat protein
MPTLPNRIPSNAWTLAQGAVLRRLYAAPQAQVAPVQQSAAAVAGSAGAESDAAVVDAPIVDDAPAPSQADALLPPQVAALLSAAAAARAAGKLEHAAGLLAQAQALAPQHARIAFAAAQVASLRGDWKAAARQYGDAVRLEGDRRQRGRARFGLGVAHVMLARAQGRQDSPQAEEAFRQAAEDRPGDGRPFLALASLLRAAGRHEDARQAAAQAAALEPTGKGGA